MAALERDRGDLEILRVSSLKLWLFSWLPLPFAELLVFFLVPSSRGNATPLARESARNEYATGIKARVPFISLGCLFPMQRVDSFPSDAASVTYLRSIISGLKRHGTRMRREMSRRAWLQCYAYDLPITLLTSRTTYSPFLSLSLFFFLFLFPFFFLKRSNTANLVSLTICLSREWHLYFATLVYAYWQGSPEANVENRVSRGLPRIDWVLTERVLI